MERGEEISNSQQLVSDQLSSKLRSHHPNILLMPNLSSHGKYHYLSAMSYAYTYNEYECRFIIKRAIKALLSLHDLGMSTLRFDASNIFWCDKDGELKLGGLVLIDASPASKKMDFQFLARVVEVLVVQNSVGFIGSIYMENVIELMDNFREGDGDLLVNHMALKSVSDRLDFISSGYERRNSLTPESRAIYFDDVVDNMSRSPINSKDWRTTIVDKPQAVFDCFNYKPHADPADYRNTNLHILRFSRNMVTHLREHLIKYGFKGTAEEIDSIIMNLFGHELLSFQKLAYDKGILKDIMPGYISSNSSSQQREGTPPQNSTIHEDDGESGWIRVRGKKSTACTSLHKKKSTVEGGG